jgi:hypothetical protein
VYDAKQLLEDVRAMVRQQKQERGITTTTSQPETASR